MQQVPYPVLYSLQTDFQQVQLKCHHQQKSVLLTRKLYSSYQHQLNRKFKTDQNDDGPKLRSIIHNFKFVSKAHGSTVQKYGFDHDRKTDFTTKTNDFDVNATSISVAVNSKTFMIQSRQVMRPRFLNYAWTCLYPLEIVSQVLTVPVSTSIALFRAPRGPTKRRIESLLYFKVAVIRKTN